MLLKSISFKFMLLFFVGVDIYIYIYLLLKPENVLTNSTIKGIFLHGKGLVNTGSPTWGH